MKFTNSVVFSLSVGVVLQDSVSFASGDAGLTAGVVIVGAVLAAPPAACVVKHVEPETVVPLYWFAESLNQTCQQTFLLAGTELFLQVKFALVQVFTVSPKYCGDP